MAIQNEKETLNHNGPPRAGRREWIGLAVIALPCILYSMDLTVLNLALPHLSIALKPGSTELLWIVDIYGFMVAGFLITMGTLGDRIGRRKLLLIGACAFGIASVFAAYSTSAKMLIAARALLGIAGATLAPSTLSLIRNMFHDPKQRTVAIGIWITSYSAGGAIGPVLGGALLEHFWWGSVFLIGVPVMVLLLLVGPFLLPEYKDPDTRPIDIISVILSLASVLSVIFGLKRMAASGFGWVPIIFIIAGVAIGMIFLRRQKKLSFPLIDLRLFRISSFSVALLMYTLATFVVFGVFIFTFQYMQLIAGLTPIKAGLWAMPFFFAFIIGSMVTPVITAKVRPVSVITAGLFLAATGFGLLTQVNRESGLIFLVVGSFIYCLGIAPVFTLTTDIIVGSAPPEKAGIAAAISETGSEFGGARGIAILGSIGTAIYRSRISENIPVGISPGITKAAKETLAEATVQSGKLPVSLSHSLLNEAHKAFISGMQIAALCCGIIVLTMAILCLTQLRYLDLANNEERGSKNK
jgi:DHA2 family multidrug resistance protein-like MFS transporter